MMTYKLKRFASHPVMGTFGELSVGDTTFVTVERPWLDNKPNVSCIPAGVYTCKRVDSPKFGPTFGVTNVKGRTHILFHAANVPSDVQGCIGLGLKLGGIGQAWAVMSSRVAVKEFLYIMGTQPFKLEIINGYV